MATKTYYLSGESRYAKVYGIGDEEYKNWQIELALDKHSTTLLKESGCSLKPRDIDGQIFYKFRRPHEKIYGDKIEKFDPPVVIDAMQKPFTALIGNGSTVTIKIEVYDTAKGKGHRLLAVRVDKHIPYESPESDLDNEVLPPLTGEAF